MTQDGLAARLQKDQEWEALRHWFEHETQRPIEEFWGACQGSALAWVRDQ